MTEPFLLERTPLPLLKATKQDVKLGREGIGLLVGVAIIYSSSAEWVTDIHLAAPVAVAFLGTAIALISSLLAIYTVCCPQCNLKWVRWALGNKPAGDWLHWLYRFTECPECKFQATKEINNS
ncbi:MAG: hypothetical protein PXX77_08385 [Gallionella sp.]|nr:hypothetical protein [Gallionella sp.]